MSEYYGAYPEHDGLERIASVGDGGGYEWDQTDVWYDNEVGTFYVYRDSGCSCNGPYDDYRGRNDLEGPYRSVPALLASTWDTDLTEQILAWERRNR